MVVEYPREPVKIPDLNAGKSAKIFTDANGKKFKVIKNELKLPDFYMWRPQSYEKVKKPVSIVHRIRAFPFREYFTGHTRQAVRYFLYASIPLALFICSKKYTFEKPPPPPSKELTWEKVEEARKERDEWAKKKIRE